MGKIRTIKPELFRHEKLFEAEQKSGLPLRLIFMGLFTGVDAEGRFRWRPRQLKLDILPYDDINLEAALFALVEFGFVRRYEYEGEFYGYIPTWRTHQRINKREPNSILPDPNRLHGLYLISKFDLLKCQKNKENAVILTNDNIAYFMLNGEVAMTEGKPQGVAGINRQNIPLCLFDEPMKIVFPEEAVNKIMEESILKGGNITRECTHVPIPVSVMQSPAPVMQNTAAHHPNLVMPMSASLEVEVEMEMEMEMEKEVEVEGCGEAKEESMTQSQQTSRQKITPDSVKLIFEHWQNVMDHRKAVLDKQRRQVIQKALSSGYSVTDLCHAIKGCSLTPHNCGQNDRGERYDGLHVIFRSADQIDRFIHNANNPPRLKNKA